MRALPFTFGSGAGSTIHGLARFEDGDLLVEFKAWSWTRFSTQIESRRISLEDVEAVDFRSGMFGARLTMSARSMHAFDTLPTKRPGEIELRFSRADRQTAAGLASAVSAHLSHVMLARMDREAARSFPSGD
ncbi:hypothetical protein BH23BAC4_BH23BAC4_05450 [soil metagenome]